jgi:hypothetical protein
MRWGRGANSFPYCVVDFATCRSSFCDIPLPEGIGLTGRQFPNLPADRDDEQKKDEISGDMLDRGHVFLA